MPDQPGCASTHFPAPATVLQLPVARQAAAADSQAVSLRLSALVWTAVLRSALTAAAARNRRLSPAQSVTGSDARCRWAGPSTGEQRCGPATTVTAASSAAAHHVRDDKGHLCEGC